MEFKVEKVLERIEKGEDLEKILKEEKWQSFEKFVAWVFEVYGYRTKLHFRLKESRREIDVVAEKNDIAFAVECKRWRGKTQSKAKLKEIALTHKEKVRELENTQKRRIVGIVVTLLETGITEIEGILFVPVFKLNNFLKEEIFTAL